MSQFKSFQLSSFCLEAPRSRLHTESAFSKFVQLKDLGA